MHLVKIVLLHRWKKASLSSLWREVCLSTQEGRLALGSRSEAEEFVITDWGQGKMNLQAASTGCYLTSVDENGKLFANRSEAFGRHVKECFCVEMLSDGRFA